MLKRLLGTVLVGGCIGIVAQAAIMLFSFLPDPMLVVIISMLAVGLVGFILTLLGLYPKIAEWGQFAADLPVCGLMFGAAMTTAMARKAGAPAGAAFRKGFVFVGTIILIGFGFCFLLGVVLSLI